MHNGSKMVEKVCFFVSFLSELRSYGNLRCVTHLYRIPMWSFDCDIEGWNSFLQICLCGQRFRQQDVSLCLKTVNTGKYINM